MAFLYVSMEAIFLFALICGAVYRNLEKPPVGFQDFIPSDESNIPGAYSIKSRGQFHSNFKAVRSAAISPGSCKQRKNDRTPRTSSAFKKSLRDHLQYMVYRHAANIFLLILIACECGKELQYRKKNAYVVYIPKTVLPTYLHLPLYD